MRRSGFKPWLRFRHASLASCIPLHTEPRCPGIRQRKIVCAGGVWKRLAWSTVNPEIAQMVTNDEGLLCRICEFCSDQPSTR